MTTVCYLWPSEMDLCVEPEVTRNWLPKREKSAEPSKCLKNRNKKIVKKEKRHKKNFTRFSPEKRKKNHIDSLFRESFLFKSFSSSAEIVGNDTLIERRK